MLLGWLERGRVDFSRIASPHFQGYDRVKFPVGPFAVLQTDKVEGADVSLQQEKPEMEKPWFRVTGLILAALFLGCWTREK